ncbi:hypothetical protein PR048_029777 [Dryococelus australis]|uniref:Uncharacterized protein n=1 Tax=Dryococelus australis TaxID=614101 RepID=A0ABQ9GB28_9NEOP|nr:hypothetical protein PR048_029777 [Dryococelus australis]
MDADVDADWAADIIERKSTTGILIRVLRKAVLRKCQKQKIVSREPAGGEYYALADCVKEVLPIEGMLNGIGITMNIPVTIAKIKGRFQIFACGNRAGRCLWLVGFLRDIPFPRPCIPVLLHTKLVSPSSASKTSMWLDYSPPTYLSFPARSLAHFRMWESGQTLLLAGGFSRASPVSPALVFRYCPILTSLHPQRILRPRCKKVLQFPQ